MYDITRSVFLPHIPLHWSLFNGTGTIISFAFVQSVYCRGQYGDMSLQNMVLEPLLVCNESGQDSKQCVHAYSRVS